MNFHEFTTNGGFVVKAAQSFHYFLSAAYSRTLPALPLEDIYPCDDMMAAVAATGFLSISCSDESRDSISIEKLCACSGVSPCWDMLGM